MRYQHYCWYPFYLFKALKYILKLSIIEILGTIIFQITGLLNIKGKEGIIEYGKREEIYSFTCN